ncbi:Cadmium/zinc-transporting ATPase HMA2 [Linum grandiflorum]
MSIAPQKATIAESGEEVDVDEVKLNTVVVVKAGEAIPIDGIVVDGQCEVDEKSLTGESFPVSKQKDSAVWAGTLNLNAEDCVVAKMAKLVEEAQNSKSSTQRFIDRCAQYYTPAIILISASFAVVPLAMRVHNRNHWFHLALVVLVSACPCALVLSTPVATFCALTKAATAGLLIKDILDRVSSIESKSSHPMAAALVDYGRSRSIEPRPENVEEYENIPGEGIHARIDGRDIYIGNKKIAVRAGSETGEITSLLFRTILHYVYRHP